MSVIARSHKGYDVVIVLRQLLSDGVTVIVCFHLLLLGLTHRGAGAPFARKNFARSMHRRHGSVYNVIIHKSPRYASPRSNRQLHSHEVTWTHSSINLNVFASSILRAPSGFLCRPTPPDGLLAIV